MKTGSQTFLPFVEKPKGGPEKRVSGLSLNRDKFIHYLTKSVEINLNEAESLFIKIRDKLEHYKGKDDLAYLEKILSENVGKFQVKKPKGVSKIKLTENASLVLKKRYLLRNQKGEVIETPEQFFRRVAKAIAQADSIYNKKANLKETEDTFYRMLSSLEFLPNTPTLMNAGKKDGQLSACFVLPINDSMESIFETLTQTAFIQKTGGGTGFNFSKIRPKDSKVQSTRGRASGPLSFISMFNAVTDTIKQGGARRGANMAILNVDHPDILEFIHAKEDPGKLTNFNISVAVTDKFMQAVDAEEDYELIHPQTREVVGKLNAKRVFDDIVQTAWKTGDPGLIFIDRINHFNPTPHIGKMEGTNPCIVGDSLISTDRGLMRMKELVKSFPGNAVRIATDNRVNEIEKKPQPGTSHYKVSQAFHNGRKTVYRLTTQSGYELLVTKDHKIMTSDGWIQVKDLEAGKYKVFIQSGEGSFNPDSSLPFAVHNRYRGRNGRTYTANLPTKWSNELGLTLGWLVGDGWLRDTPKNYLVGLTFGRDDLSILNHLKPILNRWYGNNTQEIKRDNGVFHLCYKSKLFIRFLKALGVQSWKSHQKEVPHAIFTAPKEAVIGFLQGLFSADGTVRINPKPNSEWIALSSKSQKLLKQVQLLLLNLGIQSKIFDRSRPPRKGMFPYLNRDGEVKTYTVDGELYELGIFSQSREIFRKKIGFLNAEKQKKLDSISYGGFYRQRFEDSVVSVEKVGIDDVYDLTEPLTHSMIANGMVIHQCGEQPLLPYESCNLGSIDLNSVVTDKRGIDWKKLERITKDAVHFLDNVIDVNCYPLPQINSITKANRKIGLGIMGLADIFITMGIHYNSEKALQVAEEIIAFIRKKANKASEKLAKERKPFPNFEGSILQKADRTPLRNATVITIAPTGTLSLIAGCSSGIEPIFARSFVKQVLEGETLPEIYPEHIVTAHEISPEWHVRMQSLFQRYSDNAVSKTVNLAHDASTHDVEHAYWLSYELGCKGITVYRDQSKPTQVLEAKPADIAELLKKKMSGSIEIQPQESGDIQIKLNVDSATLKDKPELHCPECQALFKHEEGCTFCPKCGFMHCPS